VLIKQAQPSGKWLRRSPHVFPKAPRLNTKERHARLTESIQENEIKSRTRA
jgi:hypothetical protein